MGRYVARRLIQFIPVILGTLFLLHMLSTLTIQFVGDPVRALFGENAPPAAVIEQLQIQYNLNDDCLEQPGNPCIGLFVDRLGQYASGDFGINFRGRAVTDLFIERFPVTVRLTLGLLERARDVGERRSSIELRHRVAERAEHAREPRRRDRSQILDRARHIETDRAQAQPEPRDPQVGRRRATLLEIRRPLARGGADAAPDGPAGG